LSVPPRPGPQGQRQARPRGNGRCARAPVGLDHVAIQNHRPLAQRLHIDHRAQAAADQPLNLVRPSADFAALTLARVRVTVERAAWRTRRSPSAARVAQPAGHALLDGGVGQHLVLPSETSTEPSAVWTKPGVSDSVRSWSGVLPPGGKSRDAHKEILRETASRVNWGKAGFKAGKPDVPDPERELQSNRLKLHGLARSYSQPCSILDEQASPVQRSLR